MVYKQKLRVLLPCGKSDKLETGTDFIHKGIKSVPMTNIGLLGSWAR